jgi:hypothetical protein
MARRAHLVGSIPGANAADAMEKALLLVESAPA